MTAESSLFDQRISELRACVDAALARYATFASGCPGHLAEAIRYSLLAPGKRLRPILVLLGAEACGGTLEAALPAACAVEMVHAYSLIHDDLPAMDDDDLRRGLPTCHKKFGEATAILAGDALLALAFEVLAKGVRPAETAAACCAALAEAAGPCQLVGGQADDLVAGRDGGGLDQLESIHRRKTGAMMLVSLRLGAMTAAADAARTAALERYGHALGLAFQITDDLLDVRGNASEVGKRLGKDQRQGKLTFPGLLGADESARRAAALVEEACDALKPLGSQAASLVALARYVLQRNR
ncbi:MAG: polyprenyl synthetase family protein [Thermoguttaceae bacterium]|nr:polyprenyl synthetase family protein [Thermoguttaceae bacterium]